MIGWLRRLFARPEVRLYQPPSPPLGVFYYRGKYWDAGDVLPDGRIVNSGGLASKYDTWIPERSLAEAIFRGWRVIGDNGALFQVTRR